MSFVYCPPANGQAVEQFVAPGTQCVQGVVGQRIDAIDGNVAVTTRTFQQFDADGKPLGQAQPTTMSTSITRNEVVPFTAIKT